MVALSISVLGPLQVTLNGEVVSGFEYNKVRALLAYLAVEAGRPHPRAHLCDLLWPDLPEKSARRNLTQALTVLRRALGEAGTGALGAAEAPTWLITTSEAVQLKSQPSLTVDAAAFAALLGEAERHAHRGWATCSLCAGRLDEALALYRGDFLSQLFLADSAPFEEWALVWREQLRQRALTALERLAQHAEWRGAFGQAAGYVRRQVEIDPLREAGHRDLMRLLALDGQQAAAEAQFERLRRVLADELGLEPEPATLELRERIRAGRLDKLRQWTAPPFNGPAAPNRLVGRDADVQAICRRLRDDAVRALTLTGTAGIGKTRLALEAAHALRFEFADGVHFVELAPVSDPALVAAAIVLALGIEQRPGQRAPAALAAWLKNRHALLVLDNFEHVREAAAQVAELLAAAPGVKVLVTSRAPLRIRAEQQFSVAPLPEAAAITLFGERARAARPDFVLTADNESSVAALCAQVDYLPLAIELIAVRARALSLADLLRELEQPLDALEHGARDVPDRHRSLRNAICWTYERLAPAEQRVFAHLGVFVGGATLEAVQAVVDPAAIEGAPGGIRGALEGLIEASVVQAHPAAGETRFTLYDTLREFALEELAGSGALEAVQARHAAYIRALADEAYVQLLGTEQAAWSARLSAELDNIRAAMRWALKHEAYEPALGIATGLWRFLWRRGRLREGLAWFEAALPHRQAASLILQSNALRGAGVLAWGISDYGRARQWLEEALAAGQAAGDAYATSAAVTNLGMVLRDQGEWELANQRLEEAVALNRALPGQPHAVKFPLVILAWLRARMGRWDEVDRLYAESLQHNRALGDVEGTANSLAGLAQVAGARGDFAAGRDLAQEALDLYGSLNHQFGLGWTHSIMANLLRDAGEWALACTHYTQSLRIWLAREDAGSAGSVLCDVAQGLGAQGQWALATRLLAAGTNLRNELADRMTPYEERQTARVREACQAALGEAAASAAWAAGPDLALAQAGELALRALSPGE